MRTLVAVLLLPVLAAAAATAACSSSSSGANESNDGGGEASSSTPPDQSDPSSTSSSGGAAGTGQATGLPCDVQAVIENRCIACHDGKIQIALLNYDNLIAPSKSHPDKTLAQVSVDRMKAKEMPPAPAAPPEVDEIASFEAWVTAGTPKNPAACTDPPPDGGTTGTGDGGTIADGGGVAVGDGGCTSGKTWDAGDKGSALMHPGAACNACHQKEGGPNLRIAGTVYATAHEPNDCNGSAPPPQLEVTITDAKNKVYKLQVNAAGNFLTQGGVKPVAPFKAQVSDGTKTRAMSGSVTSGDCNSCHTVAGLNGAPGRIMAP